MKVTLRRTYYKNTLQSNVLRATLSQRVYTVKLATVAVVSSTAAMVYGEVPSGTINGSNATFTTAFDFVPGTVQVILNGMIQKLVQDYNTSGTQTITLNVSPTWGETLTINYQKA